jgi:hypothetical protein
MKFQILLLAAAGLGCQAMNTPLYFNGNMVLTTTGNPDPMTNMQERIKDAVPLRFRNPSDTERRDLDLRRQKVDPVKVPWIARDNVHIEVTYKVTNTSQEEGLFNVSVDGATEYIKYDEDIVSMAIQQDPNDPPTFLPLMQLTPHFLGPGESYSGLFREDDFVEAETDLDAMDQFMGNFAALVTNRSDVNPVGLEMVPANTVVPAMIEVDVTFTANKAMTCEYVVRVRDDHDQLLHQDGDTRFNPTPALFQPMLPPRQ